ncbi:helix-turn-helix domain-containing protein [Microbacterium soli]|uniref:helix-turn-helix domain-containing protein n=1 Tax=Microbacterium soli TaxID=446075 RepID=UPI0031D77633
MQTLTPAETMAALGISRSTLARYVEAGKLRPSRLPSGHRRFSAAAVEAILSREPWEPAS